MPDAPLPASCSTQASATASTSSAIAHPTPTRRGEIAKTEYAKHLGEALGIDLELARAEHPVGGFAMDLLGKDLSHDAVLIVENQLGVTDHGHLGQLVTYAAGTGAKTIVWLTTQLREEHRQALDWLNEQTASDVRFFGVTVSVVRIDDSKPAPVFTVAAGPNDWQKQVRATTKAQTSGGKGELYRAFWEQYLERLRATHPDWSRQRVPAPITGLTSPPRSGAPNTA